MSQLHVCPTSPQVHFLPSSFGKWIFGCLFFNPHPPPQPPQANTQLSDFKPRDLNIEPKLPYGDAEFDVVTCVVSVDYLNKPLEIFREVAHFSPICRTPFLPHLRS